MADWTPRPQQEPTLVEGRLVADGDPAAAADGLVDALAVITAETDAVVQAFDARYVVSRGHLVHALAFAERARDRGEAIARDPDVEVLLYAAGRRQIDRALEMGIDADTEAVVVLVAGDASARAADRVRSLLEPAETLGRYDAERVRAFFDISDEELAATAAGLEALVLERVALLAVER